MYSIVGYHIMSCMQWDIAAVLFFGFGMPQYLLCLGSPVSSYLRQSMRTIEYS